jgi:hypothetical protein
MRRSQQCARSTVPCASAQAPPSRKLIQAHERLPVFVGPEGHLLLLGGAGLAQALDLLYPNTPTPLFLAFSQRRETGSLFFKFQLDGTSALASEGTPGATKARRTLINAFTPLGVMQEQRAAFNRCVGQLDAAEIAARQSPSNASAWWSLGKCRLAMGCLDAVNALRMAEALLPRSNQAEVEQLSRDLCVAETLSTSQANINILGQPLRLAQERTDLAAQSVMAMGTGAVAW